MNPRPFGRLRAGSAVLETKPHLRCARESNSTSAVRQDRRCLDRNYYTPWLPCRRRVWSRRRPLRGRPARSQRDQRAMFVPPSQPDCIRAQRLYAIAGDHPWGWLCLHCVVGYILDSRRSERPRPGSVSSVHFDRPNSALYWLAISSPSSHYATTEGSVREPIMGPICRDSISSAGDIRSRRGLGLRVGGRCGPRRVVAMPVIALLCKL